MTSINNWIGVGRLGHDPEVKKTSGGLSVCNFSIACDARLSTFKECWMEYLDCHTTAMTAGGRH